jgi:hypothetical protein
MTCPVPISLLFANYLYNLEAGHILNDPYTKNWLKVDKNLTHTGTSNNPLYYATRGFSVWEESVSSWTLISSNQRVETSMTSNTGF